ncbi:MAG: hypothetical protein ACKOKG_12490, partial [Verrucomicrobiota bacterium]
MGDDAGGQFIAEPGREVFALDHQRAALVAVVREDAGQRQPPRSGRSGQDQGVTAVHLESVGEALAGQRKPLVAGGIPDRVVGRSLAPRDPRLIAHEGRIAAKEQG